MTGRLAEKEQIRRFLLNPDLSQPSVLRLIPAALQ